MPKPLGESLLDGARPAAALRQPSGLRMLGTLLYHKELQLKIRRPLLSLVEVLLPLLLCSTVILGVTRSEVVHKPATVTPPGFAPTNITDAERTLGPGVWGMLFARDYAGDAPAAADDLIPGAVPPLGLYLTYAHAFTVCTHCPKPIPPFDGCDGTNEGGSRLAVVGSERARAIVDGMLDDAHEFSATLRAMLAAANATGRIDVDEYLAPLGLTIDELQYPPLMPLYFDTEDELDDYSRHHAHVWAAVVLKLPGDEERPAPRAGPPSSAALSAELVEPAWLNYTLRFNRSKMPSTRKKFDRFASGVSHVYRHYYSSGFLSLQAALGAALVRNYTPADAQLAEFAPDYLPRRLVAPNDSWSAPLPYGIPYPVAAYSHNTFFDFAGNLVGLVLVFSFIIPLATVLRALVDEREAKLREHLLISGASQSSYYSSVLLAHGLTFATIAALAAAELYPYAFALSSFSLVLLLLLLFALSTLTFALAIAPFFRSALLASIIGPTLFFGARRGCPPLPPSPPGSAAKRPLRAVARDGVRARVQARRSCTASSSTTAYSSTA